MKAIIGASVIAATIGSCGSLTTQYDWAGTVTQVAQDGGSAGWHEMDSAKACCNDGRAWSDNLSIGQYSQWIRFTGYGFQVPTGSSVRSVTPRWVGRSYGGTLKDHSARIVCGDGTVVGDDMARPENWPSPTDSTVCYPDCKALATWNVSFCADDPSKPRCDNGSCNVNHPDFGWQLSAEQVPGQGAARAQIQAGGLGVAYN